MTIECSNILNGSYKIVLLQSINSDIFLGVYFAYFADATYFSLFINKCKVIFV